MTHGLVSCPAFVMTIPAIAPAENALTIDHDERRDILIRRAAGTASMSLDEHHVIDIVQSAVVFVIALVRCSVKSFFKPLYKFSHNICLL